MRSLDTTVAVDHLRGRIPARDLLDGLVEDGELIIGSEMVRFEILAGAHGDELEQIERLLSAIEFIPVGEDVTRRAARLARRWRASHSGIDTADYLIAATAQLLDAPLLTTNVRHFPMFEGLTVPY